MKARSTKLLKCLYCENERRVAVEAAAVICDICACKGRRFPRAAGAASHDDQPEIPGLNLAPSAQ